MVGGYCVICRKGKKTTEKLHYFKFPTNNKDKVKEWIKALRLDLIKGPDWQPTKASAVCSLHFTQKSFNQRDCRLKLHTFAVPTLNIGGEDSMNETETEQIPVELNFAMQGCSSDLVVNMAVDSGSSEMDFATSPTTNVAEESQNDNIAQACARILDHDYTLPSYVVLSETCSTVETSVQTDTISSSKATTQTLDTGTQTNADLLGAMSDSTRKRLFPIHCEPNPEDTPADTKQKLAIVYPAFVKVKNQRDTLMRSERRLKRKVTLMEKLVETLMKGNDVSSLELDKSDGSSSPAAEDLVPSDNESLSK